MTDVAAARIEAFRVAVDLPTRAPSVLTYGDEPDVQTLWSKYAVNQANMIWQARISPADAARRVAEINVPYLERGLPFAWLLTPATTSPELEAALDAAGLQRVEQPEMYVDLPGPVAVTLPDDVAIEPTDDVARVAHAVGMGFGFAGSPRVVDGLVEYLSAMEGDAMHSLLARDLSTGATVGVGCLYQVDRMVQLVNIATTEAVRRSGIGSAVTGSLLNLGIELGADAAMLTSTELGFPVYRKLGFETVFTLVRYEWTPGLDGARPT